MSHTETVRLAADALQQTCSTYGGQHVLDLPAAPVLAYLEGALERLAEHRRLSALLTPQEWRHATAIAQACLGRAVEPLGARHRAELVREAVAQVRGQERVQVPTAPVAAFLSSVHDRQDAGRVMLSRWETQHAAAIGAAVLAGFPGSA